MRPARVRLARAALHSRLSDYDGGATLTPLPAAGLYGLLEKRERPRRNNLGDQENPRGEFVVSVGPSRAGWQWCEVLNRYPTVP